jgi:asparagine synthase (glutamine-hydrolysing)
MCGIAGYIQPRGSPDRRVLNAAVTQIRHRGPNDLGVFIDGPVGLAHARLSILDIKGGISP